MAPCKATSLDISAFQEATDRQSAGRLSSILDSPVLDGSICWLPLGRAAMRSDSLARTLDERRWSNPVEDRPALDLIGHGPSATGQEVAARYGLLAYFLQAMGLPLVLEQGFIGGPGGTWLTPTPYPGCLAPYDLGLNTPRDLCMLVDVSTLDQLWGPATADRSASHPTIWRGGAIEFFYHGPIRLDHVREVIHLHPCGDTHR